jgi:hypothetical protein
MRIGTTCEEVELELNMRHQTVSARRTDLRTSGYTEYLLNGDGTPAMRLTTTGSPAHVEIASDLGLKAMKYNVPLDLRHSDPTISKHGGNPASNKAYRITKKGTDARKVLAIMVKYTPGQLDLF